MCESTYFSPSAAEQRAVNLPSWHRHGIAVHPNSSSYSADRVRAVCPPGEWTANAYCCNPKTGCSAPPFRHLCPEASSRAVFRLSPEFLFSSLLLSKDRAGNGLESLVLKRIVQRWKPSVVNLTGAHNRCRDKVGGGGDVLRGERRNPREGERRAG